MLSMSDTVTSRNTVGFERKVNLGDYNHMQASIFVQFDGDAINDREQFEANARAAFFEAKGLVLSELGAEFRADDEGLLRELFERAIPGVQSITPAVKPGPSANAPTVSGTTVAVDAGTVLGEYDGYAVKIAYSKYGPFYVWGDDDSPQAVNGKAFIANVAKWDTKEVDGKKELAEAPTLAKAVKQIQYTLSKKGK